MEQRIAKRRIQATLATAAIVVGAGLGSYGIASAASGSSGDTGTTSTTAQRTAPPSGNSWGRQRSDETLLTGDTATKVGAAAAAKVGSGATIFRVETDADGNAAYEAHMVKADGTPITVYVSESFEVVGTESR